MITLVLGLYAIASSVAFAAYAIDKRAARLGRRRIRESTLHWMELLGGWPGALAAQALLRHKSSKARFYLVTWAIACLHIALLSWLWLRFAW